MVECMIELNQRLETRFEWSRFQSLSGSLIVPATANKPARTIDYGVPTANKPTAATLWSDFVNANPIKDIKDWKLKFRLAFVISKQLAGMQYEVYDGEVHRTQ
jgi:hypothetical protein